MSLGLSHLQVDGSKLEARSGTGSQVRGDEGSFISLRNKGCSLFDPQGLVTWVCLRASCSHTHSHKGKVDQSQFRPPSPAHAASDSACKNLTSTSTSESCQLPLSMCILIAWGRQKFSANSMQVECMWKHVDLWQKQLLWPTPRDPDHWVGVGPRNLHFYRCPQRGAIIKHSTHGILFTPTLMT